MFLRCFMYFNNYKYNIFNNIFNVLFHLRKYNIKIQHKNIFLEWAK